MPVARRRQVPNRLPAEQRRQQILDVAAELVLARGSDALTMEGLAQAAGVSKGLGYAYFANRDEVLLGLFERESSRLDATLLAALESGTSFGERIQLVLHAYLDVLETRGLLIRRLLGTTFADGPIRERQEGRAEALMRYLAEVLQLEFGLAASASLAASTILLRGVEGATDAWVNGLASRDEVEELFVRMVVGSLEAVAALTVR